MKFTKRASFNFDTFFPIGNRADSYRQGWGIGFDIETGGHVFQLMVTNAQGSYESEYIENAKGTVDGYDIYLEEIDEISIGIDTETDYLKALEILDNDK